MDFECQRCGLCCRNLIETKDSVKRGLPLTEKEANIFSNEKVSPKLGIGIAEPNIVVLYQLNANVCPLINDNNVCSKYESRPLMCRSFPIVAGNISNRCKVFSYRQVGVSYIEPFPMAKQLEASKKFTVYLRNRIKKYYQRNLKVWEYDLLTRKWVCLGLYDAL